MCTHSASVSLAVKRMACSVQGPTAPTSPFAPSSPTSAPGEGDRSPGVRSDGCQAVGGSITQQLGEWWVGDSLTRPLGNHLSRRLDHWSGSCAASSPVSSIQGKRERQEGWAGPGPGRRPGSLPSQRSLTLPLGLAGRRGGEGSSSLTLFLLAPQLGSDQRLNTEELPRPGPACLRRVWRRKESALCGSLPLGSCQAQGRAELASTCCF